MYQAIYYSRQPGSDQYHYYLRDCQKGIKCFQYFPTVYKIDDEGEYETLFGDRCTPVGGKYDRKDPNILEKDISKELVLLRDLYYKTDDKPTYQRPFAARANRSRIAKPIPASMGGMTTTSERPLVSASLSAE